MKNLSILKVLLFSTMLFGSAAYAATQEVKPVPKAVHPISSAWQDFRHCNSTR